MWYAPRSEGRVPQGVAAHLLEGLEAQVQIPQHEGGIVDHLGDPQEGEEIEDLARRGNRRTGKTT